jgi:hypothetical protein
MPRNFGPGYVLLLVVVFCISGHPVTGHLDRTCSPEKIREGPHSHGLCGRALSDILGTLCTAFNRRRKRAGRGIMIVHHYSSISPSSPRSLSYQCHHHHHHKHHTHHLHILTANRHISVLPHIMCVLHPNSVYNLIKLPKSFGCFSWFVKSLCVCLCVCVCMSETATAPTFIDGFR